MISFAIIVFFALNRGTNIAKLNLAPQEERMSIKKLPLDSGRQIIRVFESFGWVCHRGKNHFVLVHPNKPPALNISIPDHKHVDRALLKSQIRKAGLTEDQFIEVYNQL